MENRTFLGKKPNIWGKNENFFSLEKYTFFT